MTDVAVKICGLSRPETLSAAVRAGATYVGFVFFKKSPRHLTLEQGRALALEVPAGVAKVALVVDASNASLDALMKYVPIDILQLHGQESCDRVSEIRERYGVPVMKAVGVSCSEDLPALDVYARVSDQILVDAKPPKDADLPGGNGLTFDWRLIANRRWTVPWMLAGGLTADNAADAVHLTGATQVDVSSGVESAPGNKDADKIRDFIAAVQGA